MTTRNLDALFSPSAIVLIGASNREGSVGHVVARNLVTGGFDGAIMLVNPHENEICGARCYSSLADLPARPELAVIATPPPTIPGLIEDLGRLGCRAAIVITAGLDRHVREAMLTAARPFLMRIVGPNCLGFLSPVGKINASFAHMTPASGGLAFLTQSGAIATSIMDWAGGRNVGFSHILSLGDMADVDFGDTLDYLALDPNTSAILLYAESITQARKFMSAGRIAARAKPVIVMKGGRSQGGARAAASHTGALAGADAVYDAAFRRAGMLRVETLRDLFDAAETLASGVRIAGDRLAILTNGGGLGVLAADALEKGGGSLAALPAKSAALLDGVLPGSWSHANPVDILGDAHGDRYEAALAVVASEIEADAILAMNCPTGVSDALDAARATIRVHARYPQRPMLGCWMGAASTARPRAELAQAGIPNYETPDEAVRAFLQLAEYSRNQRALFETPTGEAASSPARRGDARAIIDSVRADARTALTEPEAKGVLAAYGVPVVETRVVRTPAEAAAAARDIGGSIALKILSRAISHKSDIGGVCLDLEGEAAVESAAIAMLTKIKAARPDAVIDGFSVQAMIKRPLAQELLLGSAADPTFGPCLMFGQGGVATEIVADRCLGLPPLSLNLARDMIERTRVSRLLAGYRGRPKANLDAVAGALLALSDLVLDFPEIAELDINPLLADDAGVIALDARIILHGPAAVPVAPAIRPYPKTLARRLEADGRVFQVRAIRPEDARGLMAMVEQASVEDLRFRFHGGRRSLTDAMAARLSQIDYDRELALVIETPDGSLGGVVRLIFDPNYEQAECAILVRSDLQHVAIGRSLLAMALDYACTRGARLVWGDILTENAGALALARQAGAQMNQNAEEPRLTRVEFDLSGRSSPPDICPLSR